MTKKLVIFLAVFFSVYIVVYISSRNFIHGKIDSVIKSERAASYGVNISYKSFGMGLLFGPKLHGITISSDTLAVARIEKVSIRPNLLKTLVGKPAIKQIRITGADIYLKPAVHLANAIAKKKEDRTEGKTRRSGVSLKDMLNSITISTRNLSVFINESDSSPLIEKANFSTKISRKKDTMRILSKGSRPAFRFECKIRNDSEAIIIAETAMLKTKEISVPSLDLEIDEPIQLKLNSDMIYYKKNKKMRVFNTTVSINQICFNIDSALSIDKKNRRVTKTVISMEKMPLTELYSALPEEVVRDLPKQKDLGSVSAEIEISGPIDSIKKLRVKGKINLERPPGGIDLMKPYRGEFIYFHTNKQGRRTKITVGPSSENYIPFGEIPDTVVKAVRLAEDWEFFWHNGIDFKAIKRAIEINLKRGYKSHGGSTITQQLVKNLFLTRERTYKRKLKELILTLLMEQTLSKGRILEIYLNIVELGPGIYGIKQASNYYFGKPLYDLTTKEAVYLATIIPNPQRYHYFFVKKEVAQWWEYRMKRILRGFKKTGDIDDTTFTELCNTPVEFVGTVRTDTAILPEDTGTEESVEAGDDAEADIEDILR